MGVDEAIAADVPLAVCSTSQEPAVRKKKPAPDVYNLAAKTMGLEKSECVVVVDSGIGCAAAKAAEMACIVTMSTYTAEENFDGADRIVPELGEPGSEVCVTLDDLRELL